MVDLSIIIPHFNSPNLVKNLLDSIPVKQNIEVIVIDDNSDKNIGEFNLIKNSEKYNHVIFLNNNTNKKGAGVCRNIGLNHAHGNWLLFADSDDFFVDNFYNYVSKYFTANHDVVFFSPTSIELDTGNISNRHLFYEKIINEYLFKKDSESEMVLRYCFTVPWSKLIRRKFIDTHNITFDEVIASSDVMFSTKLGYYMQNFCVSNKVIYCVTKSKGTLTTSISEAVFDSRLEIFVDYYKFLRNTISTENLDSLEISGAVYIFRALEYKLGFKKIISIYRLLRANKIKLFSSRLVNPLFIAKKCIRKYQKYKKDKKFFLNK